MNLGIANAKMGIQGFVLLSLVMVTLLWLVLNRRKSRKVPGTSIDLLQI